MEHFNVWMARASIVASLAIPLSVISANAESQRGLFLGAGWPGGGIIHQFSTKDDAQRVQPSEAVRMYSFQEGVALAREQRRFGGESAERSMVPVQLQAGYDFGAVLGYMAFEDSLGHSGTGNGATAISLGLAVPVTPNFQISGEVTQSDQTDTGNNARNSWSVTAGFRF